MWKFIAILFLILSTSSTSQASSLGPVGNPALKQFIGNATPSDRLGLVNDGSFEFGRCDQGSAWSCRNDGWAPDRIINIEEEFNEEVPAYEGELVAWLGGWGGGGATMQNWFCQELFIDGVVLNLQWSSYIWNACATFYITVDGTTIFEHDWTADQHTWGTWTSAREAWGEIDISPWCGTQAEVCLKWARCDGNDGNDNLFVDWVTIEDSCETATAGSSFSVVKSLY